MDDTREDMRRLIDMIEKGAKSTSVEQAVDDIKIFANTASLTLVLLAPFSITSISLRMSSLA